MRTEHGYVSDPTLEVLMELGELKGEFNGIHRRLDVQDTTASRAQERMHTELIEHEARENATLALMRSDMSDTKAQLETVKRLCWMGLAGTLLIGGALAFTRITIALP